MIRIDYRRWRTGFPLQLDFLSHGFIHLFFITEMASTFNPRECKLFKQEGQSYGFFLRIEKDTDGHLVRVVEKGSPAEKAGLQDGDRVLRINGVFVDKEEHMQVNGASGYIQDLSIPHICLSFLGSMTMSWLPLARQNTFMTVLTAG